MLRGAGLLGCMAVLAVVAVSGCKKTTHITVVQPERTVVQEVPVAAEPAPAVEAPPPPPVYEVPAAAPVVVAPPPPAPVVYAPAPVVYAPAPVVVEPVVTPAVSVGFFVERLGHHGRWTTVATYGHVWVPSGVAAGWQPYSMGHWVYTDAYGWTWVSDEPWGWATYHYGRWVWLEPQGWVWVPGTVWAPAWVVWRTGGGYVGWAPMPPEAVVAPVAMSTTEININININIERRIHHNHWVFVEERHVLEPVHTHIVVSKQSDWIFNATRPSTRIVSMQGRIVNRSLAVRDVERASGQKVRALRVREVDAAETRDERTVVKGDEVVMPRPRLRAMADTRTTGAAGTTGTAGTTSGATPSTAGRRVVDSAAQPTTVTRKVSPKSLEATSPPAAPATRVPVTRLPAGTATKPNVVNNGVIQKTDVVPSGTVPVDGTRQSKSAASRTDVLKGERIRKPVTDTPVAPASNVTQMPLESKTRLDSNTVPVDRSGNKIRAAAAVKSPTVVSQPPPAAVTAAPAAVRHVDTSHEAIAVSKGQDVSRDRVVAKRGKIESPSTATVEQEKVNSAGNERVSNVRRGVETTSKDVGVSNASVRKVNGKDVRRDGSRAANDKENDRETTKD
jgi:hypothetical protein